MKHSITLSIAFAAFAFAAIGEDAPAVVTASATLKDGSTVKGEFRTERIVGSTLFIEKLDLDASLVKSVSFSGTNGESKVLLSNGDSFAMTISTKDFTIKSLLGDLSIPRENFRAFALSRKASAGGESGLIFHCTFDDEASITSPAVGPSGVFNQGQFIPGKTGNALLTTARFHNAAFELPANFLKTSGCIEFWAKIQKYSPYVANGGDPRFFTLAQKATGSIFFLVDVVPNNGGGNSGFSTWTLLGNMASMQGCQSLSYDTLFLDGNWRDWHHYAVVWDKDGIADLPGKPRKALLVDGKLMPDVQSDFKSAEAAATTVSAPSVLSFTYDPHGGRDNNTKSPFLIDEFKIWSHAKTSFDL